MKQETTEKLITAIQRVLSGQVYISDKMATRMLSKFVADRRDVGASGMDRLSDRELEVFCLVGQGQRTRQIAERLHLSVKTIETYREHIKEKLNLANAAELLQYAIRWANSQNRA